LAPVVAILGLAAALRFYNLSGRSLWLDEIVTASTVRLTNLSDLIALRRPNLIGQSYVDVNQVPLSYLPTWLLRPFGDSEFMLRLPSVVEGTLLVLAVYLLARSLFRTRAGLIAALMTAVFPFAVWYSQEARSYALFMVLTTAQMYGAYMAVKRGRLIDWVALAVFSTLNLYTHYLAFLPLAAAAVYIGAFLVARMLKGASARAKAATIVALAVLAAAGAYAPYHSLFTTTRSHLALSAALAAVVLAIIVLALVRLRNRWQPLIKSRPDMATQLAYAAGAGLVVFVAYIPWLPRLRDFIDRPETSIGRLQLGHSPGLVDVLVVLERLGLSGFLLVALCVGLGVVALQMFRGSAAESGILIAWIGVSVLLLLRIAGTSLLAIDVRYLAFLVPVAIIVLAIGVDGAAEGFEWFLRRRWSAGWRVAPATAASLVVVAVLLSQALPALAASYRAPKDDWRGTAEHIAASSPPGSYVFAVGDYSDWTVISLSYYLQRLGTQDTVIDGKFATAELGARLAATNTSVWGVVIYPSATQLALLDQPGAERVDFEDVTDHIQVVRASDASLSALEQARTLLRWESQVQPQASVL
jgi:4-amino-4-deoxy-L-arabinose transferase-like glycosyltransferase